MPDDALDEFVQWLWPEADRPTRRAFRAALLGVQVGRCVGSSGATQTAGTGPVEAAGVQSPTKGGGMSERLREARRMAVEAAARVVSTATGGVSGDILVPLIALRAALWKLDAPLYDIRHEPDSIYVCCGAERIAGCFTMENAERIAALLNDAEGRQHET